MSSFDTKEAITELVKRFANGSEEKIFENDFTPQIAFYTEDDPESPRVIFFPRMVDESSREPISWATHVIASGIDNLAGIAFIHDGYRATQMTKTDGTPWGPGEMQHAFLNNTVDAHLIGESLYYSVVTKDAVHMAGLDYDRSDTAITFNWDNLKHMSTDEDGVQAAGFYPDLLRHALDTPKIMDRMTEEFELPPDSFGLDESAARTHTLSLCVKMVLAQTQMQCVIPCRSAEEQEILKRSMNEGPFSEIVQMLDQDQVEEIVTLNEAFNAPSFGS